MPGSRIDDLCAAFPSRLIPARASLVSEFVRTTAALQRLGLNRSTDLEASCPNTIRTRALSSADG